ncbi:AzlC family ABC transporter permease [Alteribacillus bidgolensis]|uniref:4-azaleucine resistance probable transporter AzlC n=1 Tax=Alteribacillus bidgolensis TaxID=930129 RepID=A0A1G8J332_9BACI|nr:AzlC family ABC transporter permease [Alteribacillus bidgolensis]SDI25708.1 4-azaleucine resistance probable transporter AzlC [Alteribacillus bidgolensis]
MKAAVTLTTNHSFAAGMKDGATIALGYFPAAITFGFIAQTTGLTVQETMLMSLLVFAGAAQYMALSLLAAGTGAIEIIFTTFIVNIRHFLMSASLNEKAVQDHPLKKAGYAFGLTDEVFAVASTKEGTVHTGYVYGVFFISYASWVIHSGVGHAVGQLLPEMLQQSLTFALYALFIALLAPSLKKHRKIFFLAALAAVLNSVFALIMAEGWAIILATLIAASVLEFIEPLNHKYNGAGKKSGVERK